MQSRKLSTLELELGLFQPAKTQRTPGSLPSLTAAHNMPERLGQGFMSFRVFVHSKKQDFSAKSQMGPGALLFAVMRMAKSQAARIHLPVPTVAKQVTQLFCASIFLSVKWGGCNDYRN